MLTPLGAATARAFWLNVRPDWLLANGDDDGTATFDDGACFQALDAIAVAIAGVVEDLASAVQTVV